MMTIGFSFNGVPLPNVESYSDRNNCSIDALTLIDRDGVKSQTAKLGSLPITITGEIKGATAEEVRTNWAAVLAALHDDDGGNRKASLKSFTDRQITAQVVNRTFDYRRSKSMVTGKYTISFFADSPYWETTAGEGSSQFTGLSTGATFNITLANMGDAMCWPTNVRVISGTTQLASDVVLTNNTTGLVWTFGDNVEINKKLEVNMKTHAVTNDAVDAINDVTHPSSDWWYLRGGCANELQIDFAGGAVDVVVTVYFTKRYLNP